jgi:two-component system sensor histidine kinase KdpD
MNERYRAMAAVADMLAAREVEGEASSRRRTWPRLTPSDPTSRSGALQAPGEPDLLSAVAHELRTPLTALATSSELLVEDLEVLDAEQVRRMVSTIHRGALWLQGLVENLLCAATIREGHFRIQPQPISLLDLVWEIRPVVEPLLAQKVQRLRLSSRGIIPAVSGDGRRIGQALVNLISNAGKFAGHGTPIDVMLSTQGDYVRVAVADRGPGIPPASRGQLFEPFYRAAAAAQSGKEGVGLGLAIVKSIVAAHGGRAGADNRRGGGARFWLELPALPAAPMPSPCAAAIGEPTR